MSAGTHSTSSSRISEYRNPSTPAASDTSPMRLIAARGDRKPDAQDISASMNDILIPLTLPAIDRTIWRQARQNIKTPIPTLTRLHGVLDWKARGGQGIILVHTNTFGTRCGHLASLLKVPGYLSSIGKSLSSPLGCSSQGGKKSGTLETDDRRESDGVTPYTVVFPLVCVLELL
jgi:hypothetical protein